MREPGGDRQPSHLERLSKLLLEGVEADEGAAKGEEGVMDVGPAFVADSQAAIAIEPGEGALDDPAVPSQTLARVDALAGDAHPDVPSSQRCPAARIVVALVGMELGGALTAPSIRLLDGRND